MYISAKHLDMKKVSLPKGLHATSSADLNVIALKQVLFSLLLCKLKPLLLCKFIKVCDLLILRYDDFRVKQVHNLISLTPIYNRRDFFPPCSKPIKFEG